MKDDARGARAAEVVAGAPPLSDEQWRRVVDVTSLDFLHVFCSVMPWVVPVGTGLALAVGGWTPRTMVIVAADLSVIAGFLWLRGRLRRGAVAPRHAAPVQFVVLVIALYACIETRAVLMSWPAVNVAANYAALITASGFVSLTVRSYVGMVAAVLVGWLLVAALRPDYDFSYTYGPIVFSAAVLAIVISRTRMKFLRANESLRLLERRRAEELERAHGELERSRRVSDELLLNVLPATIAQRLKRGESPIADGFPDVTILFADVVGFTPLSEALGPKRMVDLLNRLFLRFDEIAERLGVEKIETVGDGYLAAGGAPAALDEHPEAVAEMALQMLAAARAVQVAEDETVQVRIGINTGPVFGGVIGKKRLHYNLFGETVNTASRIQSHATAGHILVSESACKRIRRRFVLEERGEVDLKGHGPVRTWWLVGRADPPSSRVHR